MRVAIVSDIHANLTAFQSVIADWGAVDAVWCLGDIVGYGPDPMACIDLIRSLSTVSVAGNHDWAATGRIDVDDFNDLAREAALWTSSQLSNEGRDYLDGLPLIETVGDFTLAHGSPRDPVWEYILSEHQAADNFPLFDGIACFVGHSHVPMAFRATWTGDSQRWVVQTEAVWYDSWIAFGDGREIINVGSVGQPRDGDPRASYVILDTTARRYLRRRVGYDVASTQSRMSQVGLPAPLWQRLALGR